MEVRALGVWVTRIEYEDGRRDSRVSATFKAAEALSNRLAGDPAVRRFWTDPPKRQE